MKILKRKSNGFTLTEVAITTIIVGILSASGIYFYRNHAKKAIYSEGVELVQSIKEQEDITLSFSTTADNFPFQYTGTVVSSMTFDRSAQGLGITVIDASTNKYFKHFEVSEDLSSAGVDTSKMKIDGAVIVINAFKYVSDDNQTVDLTVTMVGSENGSYTIFRH